MHKDFAKVLYCRNEYYDIVRNTILFMTNYSINSFDLDDCISEVYEAVLRKQDELKRHPKIHGWLNLTAKNVAKRYMHKHTFETMMFPDVAPELIESDGDTDKREYVQHLTDTLSAKLKKSEYELFKMKFIEERTNDEIAEFIGIKKNSAEVKVTRLKNKIKKIITKM